MTLHGGRAIVTGRRSRRRRSTTSTSPPTTTATRSTSRWPRASSSCGACPPKIAAGADTAPADGNGSDLGSQTGVEDVAPDSAETGAPTARFAVGRPVRRRPGRGAGRAVSKSTHFDWRLAPLRHRRLPGARPRAAPGRPARPTTSCDGHARRAGPTCEADVRVRRVPARAVDDEDVHTALERGLIERRRRRARRQAARRPVPQRPGRHRLRMYLRDHARGRRRAACSTLVDALVEPGRARTSTRRCPAAPTCSTPSRSCSRTTCSPTRRPLLRDVRAAARLGRRAPACRRSAPGALAGSSLRARPGGRRRRSSASPRPADNSIDAHRRPRLRRRVPRSSPRMIGVHLSRLGEEVILWATQEFGFVELRRRLRHRLVDHAAEEEPRHRRAGARQGRPADRQPDRAARHAQGPAAGVQPRPAGGQGAGLRLGRHSSSCCCPRWPAWSRR